MKKMIIYLVIFICATNAGFGQLEDYLDILFDINESTKNLGEGLKTEAESISVSPRTGSISYSKNVYNGTINTVPIDININYADKVKFTSFSYFNVVSGNWKQFSANKPAWIIGVNGFAVQVLAGANMFICDPYYLRSDNIETEGLYDGSSKVEFEEEHLVWVIDGYHFCNTMHGTHRVDNRPKDGYQDIIRLLKSDGSVLELRNAIAATGDHLSIKRSKYRTGKYYEEGINAKGYAIVEYIDNLYLPSFPGNDESDLDLTGEFNYLYDTTNPGFSGMYFRPRRMHYFPGDGMEYVFVEHVMPFGAVPVAGNNPYLNDLIDFYMGGNGEYSVGRGKNYAHFGSPSIFYLEKIKANMNEAVDVSYYCKSLYGGRIILGDSEPSLNFVYDKNYGSSVGRVALKSIGDISVGYPKLAEIAPNLYPKDRNQVVIGSYEDRFFVINLNDKYRIKSGYPGDNWDYLLGNYAFSSGHANQYGYDPSKYYNNSFATGQKFKTYMSWIDYVESIQELYLVKNLDAYVVLNGLLSLRKSTTYFNYEKVNREVELKSGNTTAEYPNDSYYLSSGVYSSLILNYNFARVTEIFENNAKYTISYANDPEPLQPIYFGSGTANSFYKLNNAVHSLAKNRWDGKPVYNKTFTYSPLPNTLKNPTCSVVENINRNTSGSQPDWYYLKVS